MSAVLEFVLRHGIVLVFAWVLAEQMGLPIPTQPLLLAVGALAVQRKMPLAAALGACVLAALMADFIWYFAGRLRGSVILRLLCKISLEPDSCVRRTEKQFLRYGPRALLFAKFVPGLSAVFPPMSGMFRVPVWKFAALDACGAFLWAGCYVLVGFLFHDQIDRVLGALQQMGSSVLIAAGLVLAGYIAWKWIQRRRFIRKLRVARIEPFELASMLERGDEVAVIDLRNALEREDDPVRIPGAFALEFEDLEAGVGDVPRDRDVVLYCT